MSSPHFFLAAADVFGVLVFATTESLGPENISFFFFFCFHCCAKIKDSLFSGGTLAVALDVAAFFVGGDKLAEELSDRDDTCPKSSLRFSMSFLLSILLMICSFSATFSLHYRVRQSSRVLIWRRK